jgi:diguanylate cyclase (GGDEF)-like protein
LRASSYCFRQILPPDAFLSRLGGDEFAIIIPNTADANAVEQHCQRVQDCFSSTFIYEQQQIPLSISIGAALARLAQTPEDLIAHADQALRKAKQSNEKCYFYLQSKNK